MKREIKIWFTDFYEGFSPSDNYIVDLLSQDYRIEIHAQKPDYLFYSCYGQDFLKYKRCIKIYYTGENLVPDFNLCDYAIGFHYMNFGDRYLRYPNFAMLPDQLEKLITSKEFSKAYLNEKEFFCNFIYANSKSDPARDHFFHLLSSYKFVSAPGSHLNNTALDVGGRYSKDWMYTKLSFQERCKFTIAFENSSSPGYTTEKLMHAFISNTIPIYWGNPEVARDFNPSAFINCHNFKNFHEVVEKVKEIDQQEDIFLYMLNEPPFRNNLIPPNLRKENLLAFLKNILDKNKENAYQRPQFGTTLKYEMTMEQAMSAKIKIQKFSKFLKF